MTWLYSHPVRTAFLLITLAYGIGGAAILTNGNSFRKRAPRAGNKEAC